MDELGHLHRTEPLLAEKGLEDIAWENADILSGAAESLAAVSEGLTWFEHLWILGAIAVLLSSFVMTYVVGSE